jgi:transposase
MFEVIKPLDGGESWDSVGARMRVISRALGPALNLTMREHYPAAVDQIAAIRSGEKPDDSWLDEVNKTLGRHWNAELGRLLNRDQQLYEGGGKKSSDQKKSRRRRRNSERKMKQPDARSYLPITEYLYSETQDHICSRFSGEHLRALIGSRNSMPSFSAMRYAFFARSRACQVWGPPDRAVIAFPLWGAGKKATRFAVDPCGGAACAQWTKIVAAMAQRDRIVQLEKIAEKRPPRELTDAEKESIRIEAQRALHELEEMRAVKLGRIGVKRNQKKHKWFMYVSWTEYRPDPKPGEEKHAAVNFGINVFIQALAEDGAEWVDMGADILMKRRQFENRRWRIKKTMRRFGRGSRGHGKNRRELPLKRIGDAEHRFVETRLRQSAHDLIAWCIEHHVTHLWLEDLTGIREEFEQKTEGEAHEEVKRFIHSWPFFKYRQFVEREGSERGVVVQVKSADSVSQRCPRTSCAHVSEDNVRWVSSPGRIIWSDGKKIYPPGSRPKHAMVFEEVTKRRVFKCEKCHLRVPSDVAACANHLVDVGRPHALEKRMKRVREELAEELQDVRNDNVVDGAEEGAE